MLCQLPLNHDDRDNSGVCSVILLALEESNPSLGRDLETRRCIYIIRIISPRNGACRAVLRGQVPVGKLCRALRGWDLAGGTGGALHLLIPPSLPPFIPLFLTNSVLATLPVTPLRILSALQNRHSWAHFAGGTDAYRNLRPAVHPADPPVVG